MRWGGGTPSIDEPDGEKQKVFPQPEPTPEPEIEFDDQDYVIESWDDVLQEYINEQVALDATYKYTLIGSGTQANPWQISSALDLVYISYRQRQNANNTRYKYMILTNDIYLNDGYFEVKPYEMTYHDAGDKKLYKFQYFNLFNNNFDGKGYTIYGCYGRLINNIQYDCVLKHLHIKEYYSSESFIKSLASNSIVENVYAQGNVLSKGYDEVSGFMRQLGSGCVVKNCESHINVYHSYPASTYHTAGMFCNVAGKVFNCTNYGNVICSSIIFVGGIVSTITGNIENCKNYGNVTGNIAAGIVGVVDSSKCVYIKNCENHGDISGSSQLGGVVGKSYKTSDLLVIMDCRNYGVSLGGILDNGAATILNCVNYANVSAGGIVKEFKGGMIKNCINHGTIKTGNSGGVCRDIFSEKVEIDCCMNEGDIMGMNSAGICYSSKSGNLIRNCLNVGDIMRIDGCEILTTGAGKIENSISISKKNNVENRVYYGTDFSAFFITWKTGHIGLSALESLGALSFWRLNENTLLNDLYFTKRA